jgi:hypothetical protein
MNILKKMLALMQQLFYNYSTMAQFKSTDISQGQYIPVILSEQIVPGTFEWTINYLIDKIDISVFDQNYHNDKKGAYAYSPRALLKAILYCYSKGIISSRRIHVLLIWPPKHWRGTASRTMQR